MRKDISANSKVYNDYAAHCDRPGGAKLPICPSGAVEYDYI